MARNKRKFGRGNGLAKGAAVLASGSALVGGAVNSVGANAGWLDDIIGFFNSSSCCKSHAQDIDKKHDGIDDLEAIEKVKYFSKRIPVTYWEFNESEINAAAYRLMAPENIGLYKRIVKSKTEELVKDIGKEILSSRYQWEWKDMTEVQKKKDIERFKRTTGVLLRLTENDLSKNGLKGKFNISGNVDIKNDKDEIEKAERKFTLNEMETNLLGTVDKKGDSIRFRDEGEERAIGRSVEAFGVADPGVWGTGKRIPYLSLLGDKSKHLVLKFDDREKSLVLWYNPEKLSLTNDFKLSINKEGQETEKMYMAAISFDVKNFRDDKNVITSYCAQPKYKWNETKKDFEVDGWLLLTCHGTEHEWLSSEKFLKKIGELDSDRKFFVAVARFVSGDSLKSNKDFYFSEVSSGEPLLELKFDEEIKDTSKEGMNNDILNYNDNIQMLNED